MNLKTFRAIDMAEAVKMIKKEFGPDAVILSSRQVRKKQGFFGLFAKKELEVVAGYAEGAAVKKSSATNFRSALNQNNAFLAEQRAAAQRAAAHNKTMATPASNSAPTQTPPVSPFSKINFPETKAAPVIKEQKNEEVNERIDELKGMIEQLSKKVTVEAPTTKRYEPEVATIYQKLEDSEVNKHIADEICNNVQEVCLLKNEDPTEIAKSIMVDMVGEPNLIKATKYKQKVVMLIGPTGVGKTTTLVKIAYTLAYQEKLNIGIINADSFRVAAQEDLQAYCDILKTDLITVYKPAEIKDALNAFKEKDIILVDTAGKVSDDTEYHNDVKKLISNGNIENVYITLSAATSDKVMKKTIGNYNFLKKYSIILTKMDEAVEKGVILNVAKYSGMPISYMTLGQNVPDDITAINTQEVVESILR